MKSSWPRVDVCISRVFDAEHTLPFAPERHGHTYQMDVGYKHEINPTLNGVTKELKDMSRDIEDVVTRIEGKHLNDVLPVKPTLELLACWILAQLPPYWDYVILRSYGNLTARIDRHYLTSEWTEKLRASAT